MKFPVNEVTPENREEVLAKLEEFFEPEDVYFKPQSFNYANKTAVAAAYADTRVYYDRLNKVVGRWNWGVDIVGVYPTEYQKLIKGKKGYGGLPDTEDKTIEGFKVGCTVKVWINGLGVASDTGEKDASDENAFTSAFAQAVKRAISTFGPGKYFYDMGPMEFPYDQKTRIWLTTPKLPEKFKPAVKCTDCGSDITDTTVTIAKKETVMTVKQIVDNSKQKYNTSLCVSCQKKRHTANAQESK